MNIENDRCQISNIVLDLVKRETGENPVRTRHCNQGALAIRH